MTVVQALLAFSLAALAIASNLLNLAIEVLFVYVFDWGIAGSAWGTVIAQCVGAFAYLVVMRQHIAAATSNAPDRTPIAIRPDWSEIRGALIVGGQLMVRTGSLLATFLVASTIAARIAPMTSPADAFAAWGILTCP